MLPIAAVRAGGATLYPQETLSCAGTAAAPRAPVPTATPTAPAVLERDTATHRVDDRLRLRFVDGGGFASSGVINKPGEVFD